MCVVEYIFEAFVNYSQNGLEIESGESNGLVDGEITEAKGINTGLRLSQSKLWVLHCC